MPGTLALLPEYTSLDDPIPELRKAVDAAVAWLVAESPAAVRGATSAAKRIGAELLGADQGSGPGLLVVANGTATRTEKAPGHFDERSAAFDSVIGAALRAGDTAALRDLDLELAADLWAPDVPALAGLAGFEIATSDIDYDDAPYGVQYWVARWETED
ncbi:MAG TPA: hypothetical protein VGO19_06735 [Actinomycetes bacterium]